MENSRRFTLTDFCVICGVLCILSCVLFPRIVQPAAASTSQPTINPLASGVGTHGKHAEPYAATYVSVRQPEGVKPGRIYLQAYNNTTTCQQGLVTQYVTEQRIAVERIVSMDKNVKLTSTDSGVVARFSTLMPGEHQSVVVEYRPAPELTPAQLEAVRAHFKAYRGILPQH